MNTPVDIQFPWVILATDRLRCGQPILGVTAGGSHTDNARRFLRFATEEEARAWLEESGRIAEDSRFVYTIARL